MRWLAGFLCSFGALNGLIACGGESFTQTQTGGGSGGSGGAGSGGTSSAGASGGGNAGADGAGQGGSAGNNGGSGGRSGSTGAGGSFGGGSGNGGGSGDGGNAGSGGGSGSAGDDGGSGSAGVVGTSGTSGSGGSSGSSGSGGSGMVTCETLRQEVRNRLSAAQKCCAACTAIAQCNAVVLGLCCDETVNAADSPETQAYVQAMEDYRKANCDTPCTDVLCKPAPSHTCGLNGSCL